MKTMKKVAALIVCAVLSVVLLTGCLGTPIVEDDINNDENYYNEENVDINAGADDNVNADDVNADANDKVNANDAGADNGEAEEV